MRLRFLLISIGILAIAAIAVAAGWYYLSPSPADRFRLFVEMVHETLEGELDDEAVRDAFRDSFQYDVLKTESVYSPFRGRISYFKAGITATFNFDYRDGKWVCTQGRVQAHVKTEEGVKPAGRIARGKRLLNLRHGKLMLRSASF